MTIFRRSRRGATIEALYGAIVAQARAPVFYLSYGVPDTVNGRLDMLMLHLALVLDRLSQRLAEAGQQVFDRFCQDMDDHLREEGVGDLKVPKEMRRLAEAFFGRRRAYMEALKAGDGEALEAAIRRNVFAEEGASGAAAPLAAYMRAAMESLQRQDGEALAAGRLAWPDPEAVGAGTDQWPRCEKSRT